MGSEMCIRDRVTKMSFRAFAPLLTFRLDYEDDISSVSASSSLADLITKMTFRALALRRQRENALLSLRSGDLILIDLFDTKVWCFTSHRRSTVPLETSLSFV